jgi:hypothetical protein
MQVIAAYLVLVASGVSIACAVGVYLAIYEGTSWIWSHTGLRVSEHSAHRL